MAVSIVGSMLVADVWPENVDAFNLFAALSTQWRVGVNGATGIDYSAVIATMDLLKIPDDKRLSLFEDIRIMEREALNVMASQSVKH